jgi:hypothetical protein
MGCHHATKSLLGQGFYFRALLLEQWRVAASARMDNGQWTHGSVNESILVGPGTLSLSLQLQQQMHTDRPIDIASHYNETVMHF